MTIYRICTVILMLAMTVVFFTSWLKCMSLNKLIGWNSAFLGRASFLYR